MVDPNTGSDEGPQPASSRRHVRLPASDCDLLRSAESIAAWLGWTLAEVKVAIAAGELPTFLVRGRRHAFKTEIVAAYRDLAERPGATALQPSRNPSGRAKEDA